MKQIPSIFTLTVMLLCTSLFSQETTINTQQGLRAEWMRGSLGMLWLPEKTYNGNIEGVSIEPFINQISHLKTIDYIQLPLTSPNIYSPTHTAPHSIIESLWEGDTDDSGFPINLVVPRSTAEDPLLSWLKAVKAAGLKTEIYVNSYNLLARTETIPDAYPDISARWEAYCNTDSTMQTFINSQTYHTDEVHERRPYMFCYAEFILKEYAIRYGDLIDAWCFDSADNIMQGECGDDPSSGLLEDQRIYQAFADAVHSGNSNAAVSFNNSVGTAARPFATPTLFDDYTFGHPFGGAGDMVETESLYTRNFGICEYMSTYNGLPFETRDEIDWNDNVVGHFFPKQSTTSWNAGATGCLTNDEFVEWNSVGLINGGAITWGTPLVIVNLENTDSLLYLQTYALEQFELLDEHLMEFQYPGTPNWAKQNTILPEAYIGVPYSHTLTEGIDFWNPDSDDIISISLINKPAWLSIEETETGIWTLSGIPTETTTTEYEFTLQASNNSSNTNRLVDLKVSKVEVFTSTTETVLIQAEANTNYGIDNVAIMTSETQTAPDGLATYQISIEIIPYSGMAIVSGESGGNSTDNSFATGTTITDALFTGSDEDWIENISNIEIVNFNSNGSALTLDNISTSFNSVITVNAQSTNDNISFKFDNLIMNYGKTDSQYSLVGLESLTGGVKVNEFSIGTGNIETTNKWSIEGINITVNFNIETASLSTNETSIKDDFYPLIIYPNPTSNLLTFNTQPKEVRIYDLNGKLLKKDTTSSLTMNVSELNTGVYLVQFLSKTEKIFYKKILKEN